MKFVENLLPTNCEQIFFRILWGCGGFRNLRLFCNRLAGQARRTQRVEWEEQEIAKICWICLFPLYFSRLLTFRYRRKICKYLLRFPFISQGFSPSDSVWNLRNLFRLLRFPFNVRTNGHHQKPPQIWTG